MNQERNNGIRKRNVEQDLVHEQEMKRKKEQERKKTGTGKGT